MPIKGLTDERLAFPQIGVIRKGAPKEGNRPGKDLAYFRVVFDEEERAAAALFREVYGAQPREINILLPFDELDRVWEAWLEAYTAGRMVARADGEKFIYLLDTETNEVVVRGGVDLHTGQPRPYVEGQPVGYYTDRRGQRQPIYCKPVGRLKVVIPELRRLAYLMVLTTSIHDIMNLDAQLKALQRVNNGRIAGIPLVLRRRAKKVSVPKPNGQRVRMTKYLLSIEADERWVRRAVAALEMAARPALGRGAAPALPDGEEDDGDVDDDVAVLEGEFAPVGEGWPKDAKRGESAPDPDDGTQQEERDAVVARPYPPDVLRERIQALRVRFERSEPHGNVNGKKGVLVALLETTFNGSKAARYALSAFLLGEGKESTKTWTPAEVEALWRWLNPAKDETGEWLLEGVALTEATRAYQAAIEAAGQLRLGEETSDGVPF